MEHMGIVYSKEASLQALSKQEFQEKWEHDTNVKHKKEQVVSILDRKRETEDYDVFLCCNSEDQTEVSNIAEKLKASGILPYPVKWEAQQELPWQNISKIKSTLVFVNQSYVKLWAQQEINMFLREFIKQGGSIIIILLVSARKAPLLPDFMHDASWVDFRESNTKPMEQLFQYLTKCGVA